jgi:hypothetical protein
VKPAQQRKKQRPTVVVAPKPSEHEIQVAFFEWWEVFAPTVRVDPRLCFAIPNGGHRFKAVAGKLKAEGVKAGVSDVFLMVPKGEFHGMILEFKAHDGRVSEPQEEFLLATRREGYNALVAWSLDDAMRFVRTYLTWKPVPSR